MNILGIDPGTRYAGYAVIESTKTKPKLIDYGCLDISKKSTLMKKIGNLYEFFAIKVEELKITHIALETPFLYKNASTFLKLGYVRGILYLIAYQYDLKILEFSPREVKQQITGYGGASKEQLANIILRFFPIKKPQRDDVTDALAVALCGFWRER